MRLAIAGCGNIAKHYMDAIEEKDCLEIIGLFDLDRQKAQDLGENRFYVYGNFGELLGDPKVDWLVNLTPPSTHYSVISQALRSGVKVYSEKPLTLDKEKTFELARLSKEQGIPLVSAPITYLGDAQQAGMKIVQSGKLGDVRFVLGEMHNGFIENWHPDPEIFYQIGPLWDVGLYPLMHMLYSLGKVKRVQAQGCFVRPERKNLQGKSFSIGKPDFIDCLLEFHNGTHGRLATSFVVPGQRSQYGSLEYHGSEGSLHMESPILFHSALEFRPEGERPSEPVSLTNPYQGIDWARGLELLALHEDIPDILSLDMTLHSLEILHAIEESYSRNSWIEID